MDERSNIRVVEMVGSDPSDDAVASTSKSSDEDRPLLKLMKIVVHIVTKEEKTILTNVHLLEILREEFNIDVEKKTFLEIDIYLNVLKKFLKIWPHWDDFDKLIKVHRYDSKEIVNGILEDECKGLQKYLERILKLTEEQMASILGKLEKDQTKRQMQQKEEEKDVAESVEEGEVIMEVVCSRTQLNELIYTYPVMDTIFHISNRPLATSMKSFSLPEILNWPHISVSITLPWLECHRQNSSHFERLLKNLKLPDTSVESENPIKEIYWRNHQSKERITKMSILKLFNDLINYIKTNMPQQHQQNSLHIVEILTQFTLDLVRGPDLIALGAEYQFFLNRYKYFRHLSKEPPPWHKGFGLKIKENGINGESFDLRLEERISPAQKFQITRLKTGHYQNSCAQLTEKDLKYFLDLNNSWLKIECNGCEATFRGPLTWHHLQQHFIEYHSAEMDWICQKCKSVYSVQYLAKSRWYHKCV